MKRALAAMALSIATACGLVIDPDQLIAENGTDAGTPPPNRDGSAADAALDGEPPPNVPGCVPSAPSGTEGPYAVVSSGTFTPVLMCPAGYRATPLIKAKANPNVKAATCNDASGCTCGPPTGTPACALRVRYFDDLQCEDEKGAPSSVSSCTQLADENYLRVESIVTGTTCAASGTAAPTSKPNVTFASESWVCEPDPSFPAGPCASGEVALPATVDAAACVIRTTAAACPTSYPRERALSKDGTVEDTRGCACTCAIDGSATCTGATATLHGDNACQGSPQAIAIGACRLEATADSVKGTAGTPSGTPACTPKATPTGSATVVNDLKLCCLR